MSLSAVFGNAGAVGAIGGAINSIADGKATRKLYERQTEQTRQEAAYNAAVRQRQTELLAQEMQRQQSFARGAGDALDNSVSQFGDFEQKIGDTSQQIAGLYREFLNRKTAKEQMIAQIAPIANAAAGNRERAARAEASADVSDQAGRAADVQAFGATMNDAGTVMSDNETIARLMANFGAGSAAAGNAEIGAESSGFTREQFLAPQPSQLGDLFGGLAGLANQYMKQPVYGDGTGMQPPSAPNLPYMSGGQGLRVAGGSTGLKMPANLGIR